MVNFFSLSSCSDGNSFILYSQPDNLILIDAGISFKKTSKLLKDKFLDINNVKAIIITHFHRDHFNGLDSIIKRLPNVRIYFNILYKKLYTNYTNKTFFQYLEKFNILDFEILPFFIEHDMVNTGFKIIYKDKKIGFLSDMGSFDDKIINLLSDINLLIIESNHSIELLYNSFYPVELKKRIDSTKGHLSNEDTLKVILKLYNPNLKYIFLHHLSKRTNSMKNVEEEVVNRLNFNNLKFIIAPYDYPSETLTF